MMNGKAKQLYADCVIAFKDLYEQVTVLRRETVNVTELAELADTAYAMREAHRYMEDLTKELKGIERIAELRACENWAKVSIEGEPIRTEYVTATPKIRQMAAMPTMKKEPEKYALMMMSLGIPEYMWREEVVRPHWPGLVDYASELLHEGKPLPDGLDIDKVYNVFSLTMRKKKGVLE